MNCYWWRLCPQTPLGTASPYPIAHSEGVAQGIEQPSVRYSPVKAGGEPCAAFDELSLYLDAECSLYFGSR